MPDPYFPLILDRHEDLEYPAKSSLSYRVMAPAAASPLFQLYIINGREVPAVVSAHVTAMPVRFDHHGVNLDPVPQPARTVSAHEVVHVGGDRPRWPASASPPK